MGDIIYLEDYRKRKAEDQTRKKIADIFLANIDSQLYTADTWFYFYNRHGEVERYPSFDTDKR